MEWRHPEGNTYKFVEGAVDYGGFILSTRCGITAPGRSAGNVYKARRHSESLKIYWARGVKYGAERHETRAEAAAASWAADNPYEAWALWASPEFWRDAYRVMR